MIRPFFFSLYFGVNEQNQLLICVFKHGFLFHLGVITSIQRKPLFIMNDCFCGLWMKLKLVYVKLKEIVEKFYREEIGRDLMIEWSLLFTGIDLLLPSSIKAKSESIGIQSPSHGVLLKVCVIPSYWGEQKELNQFSFSFFKDSEFQ